MTAPEFSFFVPLDRLHASDLPYDLVAGEDARAALAKRFGLLALDRLEGHLQVRRLGRGANVQGRLVADVVQQCVVSGAPVPAHVDVPLTLHFEPFSEESGEIELDEAELDVLPVEGGGIDLGEALAQSLSLALPAYPRASDTELEAARRLLMSEEDAEAQQRADRMGQSPFAMLRREE